MKPFALIFIHSLIFLSFPAYGLQSQYYMGLQAGINHIQDRSETYDTVQTELLSISSQQQHRGITFGSNYGAVLGNVFLFQPWQLGFELRFTLSEFNHTRQLQLDHLLTNQYYTLSHLTKINNLQMLLVKPGLMLPANAVLYTQLGFGLVSTKIDTFQNIISQNAFTGAQFTQSQKLPAGIIGVGLELILSSNVSLYYDFNVAYMKGLTLSGSQQVNQIPYFSQHDLQQILFQGIFGLKWQSLHPFIQSRTSSYDGWYLGAGLGLLQANLTTRFNHQTSLQHPLIVDNRVATISPDISAILGRRYSFERFVLFLEGFIAYHPVKTNHNPSLNLKLNSDESAALDQYLTTGPTFGLTIKPGWSLINHTLYGILGAGLTKVNVNLGKSVWPFLYLSGWGLETPLTSTINLRAEYLLAFGNRVSDVHEGSISTKHEKLVQQHGSLNVVYLLS